MPKIKTKKAAAKRFSLTGGGRLRRRRAYHSHNLGKKTKKQKRRLRQPALVAPADERRIKRALGL